MIRQGRFAMAAIVVLAVSALASPAPAYVHNTLDYVAGVAVVAHWDSTAFPLAMQVTSGVTTDINDGTDRAALDRAMASWSGVSGTSAALFVEREADIEANVLDGINAIEFSNSAALDGAGFVSLTFLLTESDGTITEADMLVNDRNVGFTTTEGSNVGLDLETALLRELGRVLGLTSSPLGGRDTDGTVLDESAVMFALGRGIGESARTLRADDRAAIASLYPASGSQLGSISGRVTRDGQPVFGAHVVAHDPIRDVLVGAVTLPDGSYRIGGLGAGRYLLQANPLVAPAGPSTLGGIYLSDDVDTTFARAFVTQTVRIAAGQNATGVSVEVQ